MVLSKALFLYCKEDELSMRIGKHWTNSNFLDIFERISSAMSMIRAQIVISNRFSHAFVLLKNEKGTFPIRK